jgi:hypothetical protein
MESKAKQRSPLVPKAAANYTLNACRTVLNDPVFRSDDKSDFE